jgi:hypothetical protein
MSWRHGLYELFDGRRELAREQLVAEFEISEANGSQMIECLRLFTELYGVEYPLLRRDDPLKWFIEPVRPSNPLRSFFQQAALQDRASDLNYALTKRRKRIGHEIECSPMTVGDYVRAWLDIPF